ncbi:hypothetical protein [Jannaschia seosinensis]|uniref:hypothetical protein n=1 Tax=Jannaschia seosinensis TaxID=313367 RepID=UPI0035229FB5
MAQIAAGIGVTGLDPAHIGATLVVSGIPDLTYLPPSSRLQAEGGATMVVDMANRPCHLPAPNHRHRRPRSWPTVQGRRRGPSRCDGVGGA